MSIPTDDTRSAIEKIMAGDIKKFDTLNGIETARMGVGMLPGVGQTIDFPLSIAQANIETDRKYDAMRRHWGNLDDAAARSRGIKMEKRGADAHWKDRLGEAVTSLVGGLGGMWLGAGVLWWLPFGSIIGGLGGAIVGGMLANMAYNAAFPSQHQDATALTTTMHGMQRQGESVPPEMVFAVLASNLPKRARQRIEKDLERMTGSSSFNDAIVGGKMNELAILMKRYDLEIRADTHMKRDTDNIGKTASEQYAEWLSSGRLDARALMFTKELPTDPLMLPPVPQGQMHVSAPATPAPAQGRGMGKSPT